MVEEINKEKKFNVKEAREQAEREIRIERNDAASKKLKKKLNELADAKVIVSNIERELEDLERELDAGI